jgi:hypothetical protein
VWHPIDLPEGYHPVPRGQAWQARPAVEQDVAPGPPGGRAAPGRRDATQAQHARSVIAAEIVVEKHLTQNQVLGGRKSNRRSQRPRRAPAYVNWYINGYRRRWTSSDPNPTMRPDHGRIAGSCGVLPVTTEQKVFVAVLRSEPRSAGMVCTAGGARSRSVDPRSAIGYPPLALNGATTAQLRRLATTELC